MKRKNKIVLYICLVIVIALTIFIWTQFDNISALYRALRFSGDELRQSAIGGENKVNEAINKLPELSIRPLTEEERQQLREGVLSEEDALRLLLGKDDSGTDESPVPAVPGDAGEVLTPSTAEPVPTVAVQPIQTEGASKLPTAAEDTTAEYARCRKRIRELVAEIYVLRDSYVGKLEAIRRAAIADYLDLPEKKRTTAEKLKIGTRCIDEATALEDECDAKMDGIIKEMLELLTDMGEEQTLAYEIRYTYAEEKALKKAEYMKELFG